MSIEFHGMESYGNKTEYSWKGVTGDNLAGIATPVTSALETNTFIPTFNSHVSIIQIAFNLVGTGGNAVNFVGTLNHGNSASNDTVFYSENTNTKIGLFQRYGDDAGILIPKGSHADFSWTNDDDVSWGLSVIVRTE